MMWPIARHMLGSWDCQEGIEVLQRGADSAPYEVDGDKHPSPGGGPKATHDTALRHQSGGIWIDTHEAHAPICL